MQYQQPGLRHRPIFSLADSLSFLAQVGAVSVEVFLHKRIGHRYCRFRAFMVLPLGIIYAGLWMVQEYNVEPFALFLAAYLVAVVCVQIAAWRREWRGNHEHSEYNGFPIFLRQSLAHKEVLMKQIGEPLVIGGIGMLVMEQDAPLGVYLMFAAASLFICATMRRLVQKRRVDDMRDAVFVQQQTAGQFRGA